MIDQTISTNIISMQSESLTKLMVFITHIGDKYVIGALTIILLGIFLYKRDHIKTQLLSLTMLLGVATSQLLKYTIKRPRPEIMLIAKDGFSFPSGHATLAMAFFGALIFLFKDQIKNRGLRYTFITINILLILEISFSRIYLNVHWATDVLAGIILGIVCLASSIYFIKK